MCLDTNVSNKRVTNYEIIGLWTIGPLEDWAVTHLNYLYTHLSFWKTGGT